MRERSPIIAGHETVCIYCSGDSSSSRSLAHVYPQSIARNAMALPRGTECDDCNERNGRLDQELQNHTRIGSPIIHRGIAGKHGPRQRIGNVSRNPITGDVTAHAVGHAEYNDGTLEIQLPALAPLDMGRFRRALHHIGLNHIALICGPSVARERRYDRVRRYVRYGDGQPWAYGQFMYPDDARRPELGCSHLRSETGSLVRIRTFIDDFYVELEGLGTLAGFVERALPRTAGLI
jgi:hypothetical protein